MRQNLISWGYSCNERTLKLKELIRLIRHHKIKAIFTAKTDNTFIQFIRYVPIGIISSLADWVSLWLLYDKLNVHKYLSVAIAFLIGLLVNFVLSSTFVFTGNKKGNRRTADFSVYFITGFIGLVMTEVLMLLLDGALDIHYMAAKIITTVLVFGWNFGSKKIILSRKRDNR